MNKNILHTFFLLQLYSIAWSMNYSSDSDVVMIVWPQVVQNAPYGSAEPSTVELPGVPRRPLLYDLNVARADNGVVEYESTQPSSVAIVNEDVGSVAGISPVVAAAASSVAAGSRVPTGSVSPIVTGAGVSTERVPTLYEQFRSIHNPQDRLEQFRKFLHVYNVAYRVLPETIAGRESEEAQAVGRVDFDRMTANRVVLESLADFAFTSYLVAHKDRYFHSEDHQEIEKLFKWQEDFINKAEMGHDSLAYHHFALAVSRDLRALGK